MTGRQQVAGKGAGPYQWPVFGVRGPGGRGPLPLVG